MRKEDIQEDKFQELTTKVIKAYYRSPRDFYVGGGVLIAAIVVVVLLLSNKPKPVVEANVMFDEALLVMSNPQQADTGSAVQILTELARRYPNNPMGRRANYYLANIYYQQQKYDQARHGFEQFYAGVKDDPYLSPAALLGIANCYEQQGDIDRAAQAYQDAYTRYPRWQLSDLMAKGAGRCFMKLKKYQQAVDIFNRYLRDNPKAMADLRDEVKIRLGNAQGLLAKAKK